MSTIPLVAYDSFDSYVSACRSVVRTRDHLPFFTGRTPAALDSHVAESLKTTPWDLQDNISTVVFSAADSPAAVCAFLLAGLVGAHLAIVEDAAAAVLKDGTQTCLVALSHAIGDDALASALRRRTDACCFVTAGDLAGLSRYVARLAAAKRAEPAARSFQLIIADSACTLHRSLTPDKHPRALVQELPAPSVGGVIAEADGVLAVHSHGGDACASAGGITVLCGLRRGTEEPAEGGALACIDETVACPRGPVPLPMSRLRAQHVMQASCSSVRLRDSAMTSAFNLLLSFVEGQGLTYIGTALGGGRPECCSLYLAAMADGRTLGETLMLVNRFLEAAGLGHAVYIGIGFPDMRANVQPAGATADRRAKRSRSGTKNEYSIDFGKRYCGTFTLDDPAAMGLAPARRLALRIKGDSEVMWFCTFEDVDARRRLRVFFFSFPKPLGSLRFTLFDAEARMDGLREKLAALHRWIDYHRMVVSTGSDGVAAGQQAHSHYRDILPPLIDRLSFDGSADVALQSVAESMDAARGLLRDMLFVELETRLTGALWLSNVFSQEQMFLGVESIQCPACGRISFLRQVQGRLSDDRRVVSVCMRCGILEDIRSGSALSRVVVSCPDDVRRGTAFRVSVTIHSALKPKEFVVLSAISGPYHPKLDPQTVRTSVRDGIATASFAFEIPHTMPMHEFRWKCVIADEDDIAFISRCVFVSAAAMPASGGQC